jgi:hypothetical protein
MALPVTGKPKPAEPPEPPGETLVRLHDYQPVRGSFGLIKGLIVFLLAVLFVGVAYLGYTKIEPTLNPPGKNRVAGGATGGPAVVPAGVAVTFRNRDNKEERVLSANLDKEYWTDDRELKNQFRALVACRHLEEQADSWFAIAAQDFGTQSPRQTEMLNGAVDRLKKHFADTLQFTNKTESAKILGENAQMFPFRGRDKANFEGECFLVSKQGVGYWILVAGTDADILARMKERLEAEMALAVDRRGWREQAPEMDTFTALKAAFALKMPLGVWQKYEAVAEDGAGVLFLAATSPDGDAKKSANLLAVRLDKTADPKEAFEASRKWFTARAKAAAPEYGVALVDDHEPAKPIDLGGMPGMVAELRLLRAGDTFRYWVLAAYPADGATYALRFECAWDRRSVWKTDFLDALKTLKIRPAAAAASATAAPAAPAASAGSEPLAAPKSPAAPPRPATKK